MQFGLSKAHHKIARRIKVGMAWAKGAPKNLGFPFNISAMIEDSDFKFGTQLAFAKRYHEITLKENVGVGMTMAYGSSPKFWTSPLIFFFCNG